MSSKVLDIKKLAYHEAGHAVACYVFHRRFSKVTIVSDDNFDGQVKFSDSYWLTNFEPDTIKTFTPVIRNRIEEEVMIWFAGMVVESHLTGKSDYGGLQDQDDAIGLLEYLVYSPEELIPYVDWLFVRIQGLLTTLPYWDAIEDLAKELLANKEMGYRKARKIIKSAIERPNPLFK